MCMKNNHGNKSNKKSCTFAAGFMVRNPLWISRGKQVKVLHSTRCCKSLKNLKLLATVRERMGRQPR